MQLRETLAGSLLLTAQVSAGYVYEGGNHASQLLSGKAENLGTHLRRHANDVIGGMQRRQAEPPPPSPAADAPGPSLTPASGDASNADFAQWEQQTEAACRSSINALNGLASNPTGVAVCYNLPFLDNTTGVFQAELRLYNVSAPLAPWIGVTQADISLEMSYPGGATVQATGSRLQKRDTTLSWPPIKERSGAGNSITTKLNTRQSPDAGQTPSSGNEMSILNYVGRVNSNLVGSDISNPQVRELLIPIIKLTAVSPQSNEQLNTVLSSTEASFVNGVFAGESLDASSPAAQASASDIAATAVPFKVPGMTFGVAPIGFVITMVWTGIFVAVVGWGTFGRYQFREQYRRRIKRNQASRINNI